jgi:demethylmenaquinone methyltransferase/2-methoxy-6-polyprenyl-1,4-benzoquinol methylase
MDIIWRRRTARIASQGGGSRWMDICTGTGEMAAYLQRQAGEATTVVSVDFALPMIQQAALKPEAQQVEFVLADAKMLPFDDGTFDLITISFATRNINLKREKLEECFREFHRILKPGGRFINLETSQPPSGLVRRVFHAYIRRFVRPVGQLISGSKAGYEYLSYTIPRFFEAEELAHIIRQAGFSEVKFHRMIFGVAAIHNAVK